MPEQAIDRLLADPRFSEWGRPTYRLSRLAVGFCALMLLDVMINIAAIPTMIKLRTSERMIHGLQAGVPTPFDLYAYGDLEAMWNVLGMLTMVAISTVFLIWLYRARNNIDGLGLGLIRPQRHSPDWAVIAWFVPFVNLIVPCRVVDDIVSAGAVDLDGRRRAIALLVLPWWLLWLVSNVTGVVAWTQPITQSAAWWSTASSATEIISGLLLVVLVLQVGTAQRDADDLAL